MSRALEYRAIKLVVSDVDGTLVDHNKQLSAATIQAVTNLRASNIAFTIISARPRSGMMPIAEALSLDLPIGAFNGGTVFRRNGEILSQHLLEHDLVRDLFQIVRDLPVDVWAFAGDRWYASADHGKHAAQERIASNQQPIVTRDFSPLYDLIDKLTFVSDDPAVLGNLVRRTAQFSARATIAQSQTYYLDVTAPQANKGDGIAAIAEAIGVPLSAVLAIGDQANDLPMFARAAISVAMGQGPAEVRAEADRVTSSNDVDGVAHAITELLGHRSP